MTQVNHDQMECLCMPERLNAQTRSLGFNQKGEAVSESQYAILKAAACEPDTLALPRQEQHHELVRHAVELIASEEKQAGGQLGRPSGARFRVYERMKRFADDVRVNQPLFPAKDLEKAIGDIYGNPLRPLAVDILNRLLKAGITDADLANRVLELRAEGRPLHSQRRRTTTARNTNHMLDGA